MNSKNNNKIYQYNSKGHLALVEEYDPAKMVIHTLTSDMDLSQEQIKMLEDIKNYPVVYEEDCPETTLEMAEAFRKAARERDRQKQVLNYTLN